jgi:hypothetical protein
MDFDRTSRVWSDHDFANFEYGFEGESTVVTKFATTIKEAGSSHSQTIELQKRLAAYRFSTLSDLGWLANCDAHNSKFCLGKKNGELGFRM